jgi:hypothetical protein
LFRFGYAQTYHPVRKWKREECVSTKVVRVGGERIEQPDLKSAYNKAEKQAALSNTGISNQDELEHVITDEKNEKTKRCTPLNSEILQPKRSRRISSKRFQYVESNLYTILF